MKLLIKSAQGDYSVFFEKEIPSIIQPLIDIPNTKVIIDKNVYDLHKEKLSQLLEKRDFYILNATEQEKTLQGVEKLCTWLQETRANKKTHLILIGGGITQDIGTLAASIYYRGIKLSLVPTTLLSMADSCVGAKCAVNLNAYKNQLGVFWSPSAIYICTEFVSTLSEKDVISGHGEIYKLSMVVNKDQREEYENEINENGFHTPKLINYIFQSLLNKKDIIEKDEFDTGERRALNFGHTFGHTLEALTSNEIPHGQAVVFGIDLINFYSYTTGHLKEDTFSHIHEFIKKNFSMSSNYSITASKLVEFAKSDKKVIDDKVKFAIYTDNNKIELCDDLLNDKLIKLVDEYLSNFNIVSNR